MRKGASLAPGPVSQLSETSAVVSSAGCSSAMPRPPLADVTTGSW